MAARRAAARLLFTVDFDAGAGVTADVVTGTAVVGVTAVVVVVPVVDPPPVAVPSSAAVSSGVAASVAPIAQLDCVIVFVSRFTAAVCASSLP